jgi:TPR repeat protein
MYANGRGVPQDYMTAVKWWTLAAEQGYADAQSNLGVMYTDGTGVPQDHKTAVKWYSLAAEQGYADAQSNLGVMYSDGQGVIQDNVYAHMWWNLAASNGNENGGELRDIVAKNMTPADISAAQDLARECVGKNYKGC